MRLTTCAEFQPNERYSSVRSSSRQSEASSVSRPVEPIGAVVVDHDLRPAVVPEVQKMQAMIVGVVALGQLSGAMPRGMARKKSSCGSASAALAP